MVWIGRKKISRDVFHFSRWKLSWDNLTFELLDIIFSVTIDEREDDYIPKLSKIRILRNQWKSSKLTRTGRNTVKKTLPNPSIDYFENTLYNDIFQFLKGGKGKE